MMISIEPHDLLDAHVFTTEFANSLAELSTPPDTLALLSIDASAEIFRPDEIQTQIRDLLRLGGYKPTGRGKPASEYLIRAITEGKLSSINVAVDVCNIVSLHSGLPISVVDLDKIDPPLSIRVAPADSEYVFNATGQSIRLDGLLCLFDAHGPCANGVKDSQRTKTCDQSRRTLSVVWGTNKLAAHNSAATSWYQSLLANAGGVTTILLP